MMGLLELPPDMLQKVLNHMLVVAIVWLSSTCKIMQQMSRPVLRELALAAYLKRWTVRPRQFNENRFNAETASLSVNAMGKMALEYENMARELERRNELVTVRLLFDFDAVVVKQVRRRDAMWKALEDFGAAHSFTWTLRYNGCFHDRSDTFMDFTNGDYLWVYQTTDASYKIPERRASLPRR